MIAMLTGTVASQKGIDPVIIDVGGVGYAVHMPARVGLALVQGQRITVHIHTYVREDALELFGFLSAEELGLFHLLLNVPGIGPRTALGVLRHDASLIRTAIEHGDVDFFMSVPRLGKKNAQKIIIELRSKLTGITGDLPEEGNSESAEITQALVSMGFDRKEIRTVIPKLGNGKLEEKIRIALTLLGRK